MGVGCLVNLGSSSSKPWSVCTLGIFLLVVNPCQWLVLLLFLFWGTGGGRAHTAHYQLLASLILSGCCIALGQDEPKAIGISCLPAQLLPVVKRELGVDSGLDLVFRFYPENPVR